jgi:MYXO-CTERM domain-containing protein
MRTRMFVFGVCALLAAASANAHGPQIQVTIDNNKIVTRHLIQDGPYSDSLTAPISVYVMPIEEFGGVWMSRPNNALLAGVPQFPSGPGLAYGYDMADGGPQAFAEASVLSVGFLDGLKPWNGALFADPGATQLKGFRGSDAGITTPVENYAVTSDSGPFDSLSLPAIGAVYSAESHSSLRWALLGDGSSPTSASPDGVYLLRLQLSSTQNGLAPSDPYYYLLHKNAAPDAIAAAIDHLGVAPELVQVVPEPATWMLALVSLGGAGWIARRRSHR